jgi:hypothetical protein
MKIEELVSGKNDDQEVALRGIAFPVSGLKSLMAEGYVNLRPYRENRTISVWGKTCSACLTEQQVRDRA